MAAQAPPQDAMSRAEKLVREYRERVSKARQHSEDVLARTASTDWTTSPDVLLRSASEITSAEAFQNYKMSVMRSMNDPRTVTTESGTNTTKKRKRVIETAGTPPINKKADQTQKPQQKMFPAFRNRVLGRNILPPLHRKKSDAPNNYGKGTSSSSADKHIPTNPLPALQRRRKVTPMPINEKDI